MDNFAMLPEDCMSEIISFTSPVDASVFSVISKRFKASSESNTVWNKFLPSDIDDIISRSSSVPVFPTKRELYLSLSDSPIFLDGGKMSFSLDKKTGKKCFTVAAAELTFAGLYDTNCFISVPEEVSRFTKVAVLYLHDEFSGIHGKIGSQMLSEETLYSSYMVYKLSPLFEDYIPPIIAVCRFLDNEVDRGSTSIVSLDGQGSGTRLRSDGWMEVEIGTFFNVGRHGGDVESEVFAMGHFPIYIGIIIQGIEFRPVIGED